MIALSEEAIDSIRPLQGSQSPGGLRRIPSGHQFGLLIGAIDV